MGMYPVIIQNPQYFEWQVGDRVERTDNNGRVIHDTIYRVVEKHIEQYEGPIALNKRNRVIVFSREQEYRFGKMTYRLLSRQTPQPRPELSSDEERVLTNEESVHIDQYRELKTKDKMMIDEIIYALNVAHYPRPRLK